VVDVLTETARTSPAEPGGRQPHFVPDHIGHLWATSRRPNALLDRPFSAENMRIGNLEERGEGRLLILESGCRAGCIGLAKAERSIGRH
jgi:hypothetical protein